MRCSGRVCFWEELHVRATSKLLSSTHLKIKGKCSLKALKFKCFKYTEENTAIYSRYIDAAPQAMEVRHAKNGRNYSAKEGPAGVICIW